MIYRLEIYGVQALVLESFQSFFYRTVSPEYRSTEGMQDTIENQWRVSSAETWVSKIQEVRERSF